MTKNLYTLALSHQKMELLPINYYKQTMHCHVMLPNLSNRNHLQFEKPKAEYDRI